MDLKSLIRLHQTMDSKSLNVLSKPTNTPMKSQQDDGN